MPSMEWEQECDSCNGTGLYVGEAEGKGTAVVCQSCNGTGQRFMSFEYQEFTGRKPAEGVERVYSHHKHIVFNHKDVAGGVSYGEWQANPESPERLGNEIREYTCPASWYNGNRLQPQWEECVGFGVSISSCARFPQKAQCWAKWDIENGLVSQQA